jgi:SSS family solute:Na+ symporter
VNFLHFAILLFAICTAVLVVVSLGSRPPDEEKLAGLTFATARAPHAGGGPAGRRTASDPLWRRRDVWLSLVLAGCVVLVWLYFSG